MPVDILMPELGESVHEGTVSKWLKKVGDFVKEDEPVVEIMTDKVNTELGSPASGVLVKILIPEGSDVEVFHSMGVIEPDEKAAQAAMSGSDSVPGAENAKVIEQPVPETVAKVQPEPQSAQGRRWYSPVVRAIAKEQKVGEGELAKISGSGLGGRVTKKDIEAYLKDGRTAAGSSPSLASLGSTPSAQPSGHSETYPLAGMRKMIAEAMTRSSQVPVVSTLIEVDMTALVDYRSLNKDSFQQQFGVKLTYTPFLIKAITEALTEFPSLNSSLSEGIVTVSRGVHMGIAVSIGEKGEGGLIVPVIRDTDSKSLVDIAKDLEGLASKARSNKLDVKDVQGATFTLTNPGSYGAVLGTPMINAPQAGILGAYGIIKRPVIINDMIAVRSMMNLVLTYDHRLVDGLLAGRFLQAVKAKLEGLSFFK